MPLLLRTAGLCPGMYCPFLWSVKPNPEPHTYFHQSHVTVATVLFTILSLYNQQTRIIGFVFIKLFTLLYVNIVNISNHNIHVWK